MRSKDQPLTKRTNIGLSVEQPNTKEFTCLSYTELVLELEHLKIETRLINEMFANVMGECEN